MDRVQLGTDELTGLARRILTAHRTSEANAAVVAGALNHIIQFFRKGKLIR